MGNIDPIYEYNHIKTVLNFLETGDADDYSEVMTYFENTFSL